MEEPEKKLNASKEPKVKEIGIEDEAERKEICLFSFNMLINVKCQLLVNSSGMLAMKER